MSYNINFIKIIRIILILSLFLNLCETQPTSTRPPSEHTEEEFITSEIIFPIGKNLTSVDFSINTSNCYCGLNVNINENNYQNYIIDQINQKLNVSLESSLYQSFNQIKLTIIDQCLEETLYNFVIKFVDIIELKMENHDETKTIDLNFTYNLPIGNLESIEIMSMDNDISIMSFGKNSLDISQDNSTVYIYNIGGLNGTYYIKTILEQGMTLVNRDIYFTYILPEEQRHEETQEEILEEIVEELIEEYEEKDQEEKEEKDQEEKEEKDQEEKEEKDQEEKEEKDQEEKEEKDQEEVEEKDHEEEISGGHYCKWFQLFKNINIIKNRIFIREIFVK